MALNKNRIKQVQSVFFCDCCVKNPSYFQDCNLVIFLRWNPVFIGFKCQLVVWDSQYGVIVTHFNHDAFAPKFFFDLSKHFLSDFFSLGAFQDFFVDKGFTLGKLQDKNQ